MKAFSILVQRKNEKTGNKEWALVSKEKRKVLKWFGTKKPTKEEVAKEERRVQYWKSQSSLYPVLSLFLSEQD